VPMRWIPVRCSSSTFVITRECSYALRTRRGAQRRAVSGI
jgi:hypothetical protein